MAGFEQRGTEMRRDGSSLLSLASWLDRLDEDFRDLTARVRLSQQTEASDYHTARLMTLGDSLDRVADTVSELLHLLTSGEGIRGSTEARLLCVGLISQWMENESRSRRAAQAGIHGNTSTFPLSSVIQFVAGQNASGLLKILTDDETLYVEFNDGDIVHAASDNAPEGERLGEILVSRGALTPSLLRDSMARISRQRSVGLQLIDQGVISDAQLEDALETQVRRILTRILPQHAIFEFHEDGDRRQPRKVRVSTLPLLVELRKTVVEPSSRQRDAR